MQCAIHSYILWPARGKTINLKYLYVYLYTVIGYIGKRLYNFMKNFIHIGKIKNKIYINMYYLYYVILNYNLLYCIKNNFDNQYRYILRRLNDPTST